MVHGGALPGEVYDTAMMVILEYVFPYDVGFFFFCEYVRWEML